jgi:hypothetical protein
MAKRLLAVLLAVGLIVGAILLRRAIDGDDDDSEPVTTSESDGPTEIWCLDELRAACEAAYASDDDVALEVMSMQRSFDRMVGGDVPAGWVTFAPLPDMAKELSRGNGRVDPTDSTLLASTPMVVASKPEQAQVLTTACPDPTIWRCIGDHAGQPWTTIGGKAEWQTIKPSLGNPVADATALMLWVSAAGHYLGKTGTYEAFELEADEDNFLAWKHQLQNADPTHGAGVPIEDIQVRPAINVAGGLDMQITTNIARVGASYGQVDAVLAQFAGADLARFAQPLTNALVPSGWSPPPVPLADRPSATTYIAVRDLWDD